jgi:hypothetical protein
MAGGVRFTGGTMDVGAKDLGVESPARKKKNKIILNNYRGAKTCTGAEINQSIIF